LALLRSLLHAKVPFLRFTAVDVCNNIRCKAVPLKELLDKIIQPQSSSSSSEDLTCASPLDSLVSIATVCFAGLPSFGDITLDGTARHGTGWDGMLGEWSYYNLI